ncbi:hypothetical protein AMTR_s00034p00229600 [Amborella trichopoda]|uniref:Uncharacterized protein n=1 Tax=Amborella trichopoda TaxID=13333 RepID=W1PQF8_AMBTC|nr:hypothetical protein AMTR_s00034p00229600 [Amborella trichopoda]
MGDLLGSPCVAPLFVAAANSLSAPNAGYRAFDAIFFGMGCQLRFRHWERKVMPARSHGAFLRTMGPARAVTVGRGHMRPHGPRVVRRPRRRSPYIREPSGRGVLASEPMPGGHQCRDIMSFLASPLHEGCGHTSTNAPDPIRTPKLSVLGQE